MVSSRRARIAIVGTASVLLTVLLATLLAAVWPLPEAPVPSASSPLLIRGATVIRPGVDRVEHGMDVLVADGRIQAVGERLPATPGARVMDAEGRYLIPGLWDAHAHTWQVSPQLHLRLYVANGVTSLRDMMGCPEPRSPW